MDEENTATEETERWAKIGDYHRAVSFEDDMTRPVIDMVADDDGTE